MIKRGNRSNFLTFCGIRNALFASLFLILVVLVVLHWSRDHVNRWNAFRSEQFHPTVEFRNGTDVIWQIPDSPKAVLFLAHGCSGRALHFWDKSTACPNCVGLPEERLLSLHALSRNFAVITVSSAGKCWTFGEEMLIVKEIITRWVRERNLEKLPLVALGASSGGYFVSALANILRFSSITVMIAEGMFDQFDDIPEDYSPTLFVHMPKDSRRQQQIVKFVQLLKKKGIDSQEIECLEFPLSPTLLAERIPGLDQTVSTKLFKLFNEKGFIDENRYMKKDGRVTPWKKAVKESKDRIMLGTNLMHHVQEELNLAYAYHEMTSLQSDQIFRWFESHMK